MKKQNEQFQDIVIATEERAGPQGVTSRNLELGTEPEPTCKHSHGVASDDCTPMPARCPLLTVVCHDLFHILGTLYFIL